MPRHGTPWSRVPTAFIGSSVRLSLGAVSLTGVLLPCTLQLQASFNNTFSMQRAMQVS